MRSRALALGVLSALAVGLVSAASALAVTAVNCSDVTAVFGTAGGEATAGGVYQLPAGVCSVNVIATNTNPFTLEGATGAGTTLEPASTAAPIISSSGTNVAFTLSGMTFTGASGAPALSIQGSTTPVTLTGDPRPRRAGARNPPR
jgi:hypothetical protein